MKAHVLRRVKLLDGMHQPDVAFLNEVHVVGASVEIFGGNRNGHAQVGHDELHGGVAVPVRSIFMEQAQFFFFGEVGIAPDFGQILLKRRNRHHGCGIRGVMIFRSCTVRHFGRRTDLGDLLLGRAQDLRFDRFFVEILLARTHDGRDYHKNL